MMAFLQGLLFFSAVLLLSCSTGDAGYDQEIQAYASRKGWILRDTAGVYVYIEDEGGKEKPTITNTILLSYKASYIDDVLFDASPQDAGAEIILGTAVSGLRKGLALFGKKGKGAILIPPSEAYGNNPPFGVREGAVLVYSVEIEDIF